MLSNFRIRKLSRKQKRCEMLIQNEYHIQPGSLATKYLAILNAGLSTGLTEELVLLTAEQYGKISKLIMLPTKSYCFLECSSVEDAVSIFEGMHGKAAIGQNEAVVYLKYFQQLPAVSSGLQNQNMYPPGLFILKDFVTLEEEAQLLEAIDMDTVTDNALKHRKVKHFGYEFLYGSNNVDMNKPLERKIPNKCDMLWKKLEKYQCTHGWDWQQPDQLTVNLYEPGQGIPAHVDTHSAFLQPILSLSLKSDIIMEFRRRAEKLSVYLPKRSLLIMSEESRYDWTHGITPRVYDVITTSNGNLSTQRRQQRISLTFRKLRTTPCNCHYPTLCDSKNSKSTQVGIETEQALALEDFNVHKVYEQIAEHFSETRHTPWPMVKSFLLQLPEGSTLLDVGCGNGKYLNCNPQLLNIGCDRSENLLKVCHNNQHQGFRCDCLNLPVRSGSIDGCLSIAVIHHLSTRQRRLKALQEMVRVLRPSGKALIYVWAKNQKFDNKKSSYLKQNKAVNKEKITSIQQKQKNQYELREEAKQAPVQLPIHTNRTEFEQQDVLVPWKIKDEEKSIYLRYYHVFEEGELEDLLKEIHDLRLLSSYYDQGNHCCVIEKN